MDEAREVVNVRNMLIGVIVAECIIAFCCLAFEVSAARLVAPYAGLSTDTWTAIIAAFLLAVALGNRMGGRLAVGRSGASQIRIAALASAAGGLAVAGLPFIMDGWDRLVLASAPASVWRIVLFSSAPCIPAGVLFGISQPLLMLSVLRGRDGQGVGAGLIYAAGAVGSVLGVLAANWVLLDSLGVQRTLWLLFGVAQINAAGMLLLAKTPQRPAVAA